MRAWLLSVAVITACGRAASPPAEPAPVENQSEPTPLHDVAYWEAADRDWVRILLRELMELGVDAGYPEVVELARRTEALVQMIENGELTRPQLLELHAANEARVTDPAPSRVWEILDDVREAFRRIKVR